MRGLEYEANKMNKMSAKAKAKAKAKGKAKGKSAKWQ